MHNIVFSKLAQRVRWAQNMNQIHFIITCSSYDIDDAPNMALNNN